MPKEKKKEKNNTVADAPKPKGPEAIVVGGRIVGWKKEE